MELKTVESLFHLVGIEILSFHKLHNEYYTDPRNEEELRHAFDNPWWLVETPYGLIKIGYRKRVTEVNWERTKLRRKVTEDDVTSEKSYVHAWTEDKLLTYLRELAFQLKAQAAGI
jgi:hypothetical protein